MEDEPELPDASDRGCLGTLLIGLAPWLIVAGWLSFGLLRTAFYAVAFVLIALGVGVWTMGGNE